MYLCVIIFIVFLFSTCIGYIREYALVFREYSFFISIDGKHKIKVGEPSKPIASAERGKRVLVRSDEFFSVMDHDFTKFGLVPSVIFFVHIPEEITDSLHHGMCIFSLTHVHLVNADPKVVDSIVNVFILSIDIHLEVYMCSIGRFLIDVNLMCMQKEP